MRKTLSLWVVLVGLVGATPALATASFANRNLGLGLGGFTVLGDKTAMGIDWGLPLTLEGGFYLESGFELFLRVPLMLVQQKTGVTADGGPGIVVATGGQFGARYLFLEENVRPWVGLQLAGLYFFRSEAAQAVYATFFAGPGVSAGLDFFVAESVSLGVRAYTDLYITLNKPLTFTAGGGAYVTTYF